MAARRRKRSETTGKSGKGQRDAGDLTARQTLRGASLWALKRLEVLEDGRDAAAQKLGERLRRRPGPLSAVTDEEIALWMKRGVPRSILGDAPSLAIVFTEVSALIARHDETDLSRGRKVQKLAFTGLLDPRELRPGDDPSMARRARPLDEIRAGTRLRTLGKRLVRELEQKGLPARSEASVLAEELGAPQKTIEGWLEAGRVTGSGLSRFRQYEAQRKAEKSEERGESQIFQKLLQAGRKPHVITTKRRYYSGKKAEYVTETTETEAPQVPVFRPSHGYYGGDYTSGYRWAIPIRQYLSPALIGEMTRKALAVPLAPMRKRIRHKLPDWLVFAVVSVLYKHDAKGPPREALSGSKYKYGKNIRQDLVPQFPELALRFVVKDAYYGGKQPTLKEAVEAFDQRLWIEVRGGDRVWIHGVVVWHYRRRTREEIAEFMEKKSLEQKQRRKQKERIAREKAQRRLSRQGRAARAAYESRKKGKKS